MWPGRRLPRRRAAARRSKDRGRRDIPLIVRRAVGRHAAGLGRRDEAAQVGTVPPMTAIAPTTPFLHPFTRPAAPAESFISVQRGMGARVMDTRGRWYVDGLAALWYCNVGHGRRELIDAAARQMGELATFHSFDIFTNPAADELARRLVELAPMSDSRVFFTNSGSEAVDTAMKLARLAQARAGHPERTVIVSRVPSYHGVTYGGLSATGNPANHEGFGPLVGDVIQVPAHDLDALDAVFAVHGDRIAAVIAEPVIGAGGVHPAVDGYLQGVRERCDRHGAFLVLDEVITGFGRLGRWWGAEFYGVRPDLVTFAKAVTSGYVPLGGVLVGPDVHQVLSQDPTFVLRHGNTYAGHPTACAVALANLDVIESDGLLERATQIGDRLVERLAPLVDGERVREVRGEGAVRALGFGEGLDATSIRNGLLERGVILRPLGASTLAICPPLVISDDELDSITTALADEIGSRP